MAPSARYLATILLLGLEPIASHDFRIRNWCSEPVWVGILGNGGTGAPPMNGGFFLAPGGLQMVSVGNAWGGRFWGRTGCDKNGQNCATGDCGPGTQCAGAGGAPPVTLAEFTLDWASGTGPLDFYDVSLVDGFNLPMSVRLLNDSFVGERNQDGYYCGSAGCDIDLNPTCPDELKVVKGGETVACMSACSAFKTEEYCCGGAHNTPETCPPTSYSETFKAACPRAYSYAYDDFASTYTCHGAVDGATNYQIAFCRWKDFHRPNNDDDN